jgi:hypothetical protein
VRWVIAAMVLMLVGAAPGRSAMQTDVGVLTCTLAQGDEKGTEPDSQTRGMLCSFKPMGTGPEESYTGEIKKVGSQTELSGKKVLIWAVMGPADRKLKPAVLAQTYVGEAPTDTPNKAQPAKRLVGERDKAYALHPITDDAHAPEAATSATVVELRLKATPA